MPEVSIAMYHKDSCCEPSLRLVETLSLKSPHVAASNTSCDYLHCRGWGSHPCQQNLINQINLSHLQLRSMLSAGQELTYCLLRLSQ